MLKKIPFAKQEYDRISALEKGFIKGQDSDVRQDITAAGALDLNKSLHVIDSTAGAFNVTLAAPSLAQEGQIKTVYLKTDGGDVLITPLTNVVGIGTSITFNDAGDIARFIAINQKWVYMGSAGPTIV